MKVGTKVDHRLRLYDIPIRWCSEITEWDPPHKFTDIQIKVTYRFWQHKYFFSAEGNHTRMINRVEYAIPGWFLAPIVHSLFVRNGIWRRFLIIEKGGFWRFLGR
jgi:ligand-binding SRPBCC domain-containing protein